ARLTVALPMPSLSAISRSESPGLAAMASAARLPAGIYATPHLQFACVSAPHAEQYSVCGNAIAWPFVLIDFSGSVPLGISPLASDSVSSPWSALAQRTRGASSHDSK